jgi:hypothetical protein
MLPAKRTLRGRDSAHRAVRGWHSSTGGQGSANGRSIRGLAAGLPRHLPCPAPNPGQRAGPPPFGRARAGAGRPEPACFLGPGPCRGGLRGAVDAEQAPRCLSRRLQEAHLAGGRVHAGGVGGFPNTSMTRRAGGAAAGGRAKARWRRSGGRRGPSSRDSGAVCLSIRECQAVHIRVSERQSESESRRPAPGPCPQPGPRRPNGLPTERSARARVIRDAAVRPAVRPGSGPSARAGPRGLQCRRRSVSPAPRLDLAHAPRPKERGLL